MEAGAAAQSESQAGERKLGGADKIAIAEQIIDRAADAIFLLDDQGRTTFANRAAEEMFGWSAEELSGRKLHDVIHYRRPDGSAFPMDECPLGRVFSTGRTLGLHEDTFFHRDGRSVHVTCSNAPVTGEAGLTGGVLIVRDTTTRKRGEEALRESEEKLRAITDSVDQMIWSTRPDGYHDYYNQRWYDFTGVAHGSTDGDRWNAMFHPDDRERAWATWRHSLATGERYHIEYRLRDRNGEYRWVLGRAQPVRDEQGRIIRWYGTCTDIHDIKEAEDELRRTSALVRLIGDSTPDLIYAKDRQSRILYANKSAAKVIGLPLDELIGTSDLDFASPAEAARILENDRRVLDHGELIDVDEVFTGPDGDTRHFRSVKSPLRDSDGEIIGLVGVTSDVTARRQAEERERLLAREVDHRAKNLLAVVQSIVQLTRSDDPASFTRSISGRIQALARAHSLLAAARWEGADLQQLVAEELAPYSGRGAKCLIGDSPNIRLRPEAAQALALVIHELATNAAKYGSLSVAGGEVAIGWSVAGTGAEGRLVFDWQERGGPPVSAPARSGFGSTVMRASVERQLKGKVDLEWAPDGLRCRLAIPADQLVMSRSEAKARDADRPGTGEQSARSLSGRRILVLEDEALIAMQLEQALAQAGCEIVGPATRLSEAFDLIYSSPIDAALLDVNVAGERSYAIADILRAKSIPFAFVTGFEAGSILPAHFQSVPVLAKPFENAQLEGLLTRL